MQMQLDEIAAQVRGGPKYGQVNAELVRRIGTSELGKRASFKDAVKATKNKLHQVAGMFTEEKARYSEWLEALGTTPPLPLSSPAREEALRRIMTHHASTRERLPILDTFYVTIFADLHPITSVLDLACGLNPLAIPWMGLEPEAAYHAVDIYDDLMTFLQSALDTLGVRGVAESRDVIADCPQDEVDVALVLKAIPCLEKIDKRAGEILLDTIKARHIIVSFPTRTVGGRNIGMAASYDVRFKELVGQRSRGVKRYEFENELVFVISK